MSQCSLSFSLSLSLIFWRFCPHQGNLEHKSYDSGDDALRSVLGLVPTLLCSLESLVMTYYSPWGSSLESPAPESSELMPAIGGWGGGGGCFALLLQAWWDHCRKSRLPLRNISLPHRCPYLRPSLPNNRVITHQIPRTPPYGRGISKGMAHQVREWRLPPTSQPSLQGLYFYISLGRDFGNRPMKVTWSCINTWSGEWKPCIDFMTKVSPSESL